MINLEDGDISSVRPPWDLKANCFLKILAHNVLYNKSYNKGTSLRIGLIYVIFSNLDKGKSLLHVHNCLK